MKKKPSEFVKLVESSSESIPTMRTRTARVGKPRQMTIAKRMA